MLNFTSLHIQFNNTMYNICYCMDMSIMMELGYSRGCAQWRLFIDSSVKSESSFNLWWQYQAFCATFYAIYIKKSDRSMKNILTAMKYDKCCWSTWGHLQSYWWAWRAVPLEVIIQELSGQSVPRKMNVNQTPLCDSY